jgi:hypothetical protein
MSFAKKMGGVADRLLSKYDERTTKVKLLRAGARVWDDTLAEYIFSPPTEHDLTGVASSYSQAMINGTTIQADDIRFVSTRAEKPTQDDKVVLDGTQYSIVSIKPYAYTGEDLTIAYEMQLRK